MIRDKQDNATAPGGSGSSVALAYSGAVSAGSFLWCAVVWDGATTTCTVADSVNGAWTALGSPKTGAGAQSTKRLQFFYFENSGAGTPTVTATFSISTSYRALAISEHTGSETTGAIRGSVSYDNVSGASPVSAGIAVEAGDVLMGAFVPSGTGDVQNYPDHQPMRKSSFGGNISSYRMMWRAYTATLGYTDTTSDNIIGVFCLKGKAADQTGSKGSDYKHIVKGVAHGYILDKSDTAIKREFDETAAAGSQMARFDINTNCWSAAQTYIPYAQSKGLEILALITGATKASMTPTQVNTLVDTMGPWFRDHGVVWFEFMNEVNASSGSWGTPDPVTYTAALKAFNTRIKSYIPNAKVLSSGLASQVDNIPTSYAEPTFFQAMLDNGLTASDIDGVATHPYLHINMLVDYSAFWKAWESASSIRVKMNANGMSNLGIYVTECGTDGDDTDLAQVVEEVSKFFKRSDMGKLGFWLMYSAESSDGYAMWPSGVAGARATAYAGITVPKYFVPHPVIVTV